MESTDKMSEIVEVGKRPRQRGFSLVELMIVVLVTLILLALALPTLSSILRGLRIAGDARSIAGLVGQAKMRAAADFTQARLYFDLTTNSFRLELWNKGTSKWDTEGGATALSQGVLPGFGGLATPPAKTQAVIGQAPLCNKDTSGAAGTIANTACVVFNSRGIPIDNTGAATANDAIYLTDSTVVYAVTVGATGLVLNWMSPVQTAAWGRR